MMTTTRSLEDRLILGFCSSCVFLKNICVLFKRGLIRSGNPAEAIQYLYLGGVDRATKAHYPCELCESIKNEGLINMRQSIKRVTPKDISHCPALVFLLREEKILLVISASSDILPTLPKRAKQKRTDIPIALMIFSWTCVWIDMMKS